MATRQLTNLRMQVIHFDAGLRQPDRPSVLNPPRIAGSLASGRRRALASEQNFRRIRRQLRYHHSAARRLLCGSVLRRGLSAAKTGQERQHPAQAEGFS